MQRKTNLVCKPKWNLQGEQWQKSPNSYKQVLTYEKRTFRSYIVMSTGTSFAKLGRKPTRIRTMTKKEYASLLNLWLAWTLCKQLMSLHGHPPGRVSGIYILTGVYKLEYPGILTVLPVLTSKDNWEHSGEGREPCQQLYAMCCASYWEFKGKLDPRSSDGGYNQLRETDT